MPLKNCHNFFNISSSFHSVKTNTLRTLFEYVTNQFYLRDTGSIPVGGMLHFFCNPRKKGISFRSCTLKLLLWKLWGMETLLVKQLFLKMVPLSYKWTPCMETFATPSLATGNFFAHFFSSKGTKKLFRMETLNFFKNFCLKVFWITWKVLKLPLKMLKNQ